MRIDHAFESGILPSLAHEHRYKHRFSQKPVLYVLLALLIPLAIFTKTTSL